MSEASQDKTIRKYLHYLTDYEWTHRYSVFYRDKPDSVELVNHLPRFKHELRRKYPETPFLLRVLLLNRGELQAYVTITTNRNDLDIQGVADKTFPLLVKAVNQSLTAEKISSISNAIRTQRPHDLNRFFGSNTKRWSILNRSALIPLERAVIDSVNSNS